MRNRFFELIYSIAKPFVALLYPHSVRGVENVPEGGVLLCPNHASAADPVVVALSLPRRPALRFMAKAELFSNRLLNWFFLKLGGIPVHRGSGDINSVKTSLKCLQEGQRLLLFPEGTRVEKEGDVDAKGGAIVLAGRTGVPIVPIYCGGKKQLFHRCEIIFGEPYHPQFAGRRPTAEETRALSEELLEKIYALKDA